MNPPNPQETFVINRTFATPIERMYQVWTDPKELCQWLPPTGFQMQFTSCDIKPGGTSIYCMFNAQGAKMYGRSRYISLERPNRIVYTQQFCDESGKVARHPMSPTWPETMLTTVDFTAVEPGKTQVTVCWQPVEGSTDVEIDTFVKARAGMTQGWTGSFDKLETYLR